MNAQRRTEFIPFPAPENGMNSVLHRCSVSTSPQGDGVSAGGAGGTASSVVVLAEGAAGVAASSLTGVGEGANASSVVVFDEGARASSVVVFGEAGTATGSDSAVGGTDWGSQPDKAARLAVIRPAARN